MTLALYPGTFDPVTNGHVDLIERASRVFDRVRVALFVHPDKTVWFSVAERLAMLREATAGLANVEVAAGRGLVVEYARAVGAQVIVRGLRPTVRFDDEFQMTTANRRMAPEVETFFLWARTEYGFVSSSLVKELAEYGADLAGLVPEGVEPRLRAKVAERRRRQAEGEGGHE